VHRLPRDDASTQRLIEDGYALSLKMSWKVVVDDYLLPGLERACGEHPSTAS
jgi:hypothetical protein